MLWSEMRRGEAGRVAPLMALIGALYLLLEDRAESDWIGWWADTSIVVQLFGVIVMGSVLAATACWTASRGQRDRTRPWTDTAARGGWSQALLLWASVWLWTLLAYVLHVVIAFGRTAGVSDEFAPVWEPLLLGAAMLALQIAVGVVVGTLLPSRLMAPAVGAFWYALFVAAAFAPGSGIGRFAPAVDEHWAGSLVPDTALMLTSATWCLAATGAVLAVPALARRPVVSPRRWGVIPVAVVALGAAAALVALPEKATPWAAAALQPDDPPCATTGRTTACLWPANRHLLPRLERAVADVDAALGPLEGFNRRLNEQWLDPGRVAGESGEFAVMTPDVGVRRLSRDLLAAAMPRPPEGCEREGSKAAGGLPDDFLLVAVVHHRAEAPYDYYGEEFAAAVEKVVTAPRAEQDAWIGKAVESVRGCRPLPGLPR
ncbi:hypothetical protein GL263_18640 [Streptomyces durbertensis]|uniref:ABC transporter permease n=1 Tax=Streptomyces durbertensis TaxID=2448886 RepID=A0ABR6EJP7_9ACTN|nr:hypothetical protein [Streptomyces durbertensis]MBB1245559.1 hypothetical protein [Streptomyces durbertensis]